MQMFKLCKLLIILVVENKRNFMEASDRQIEKLVENSLPRNMKKNARERSKCICLEKLIRGLSNKLLACW